MKKNITTSSSSVKVPVAGQVKASKFEPKQFVKSGLSEEDVIEIKQAFDLFDTDQGGSIDTKCNLEIKFRIKSSNDFIGFRIEKCSYLPNGL
jgi:hypothetical protein